MRADSLFFMEDFYGCAGKPDINLFSNKLKRNAVEIVINFDVVINVNACFLPASKFVGNSRQRQ